MLPKHDIYKYFMGGQDLGLIFYCCMYSYSHMISSLYFWIVKSDDGCLVQLKHIAFLHTIIKCWVLTACFTVAYYKYYNKKSAGETAITHADVDRNQSSVILYINIK